VQWTQAEGQDAYAATRNILASPPIFTVPPGGEQIVRVGLRQAPDALMERSYRVYLQEVPTPAPSGFKGMRVALRLGIPVFVAPGAARASAPLQATLQWGIRTGADGMLLTARNPGNAHVEVTRITLALKGESKLLFQRDVQGYVLPGQHHEWKFDHPLAPGSLLHVSAKSDAGPIEADVVVAAP